MPQQEGSAVPTPPPPPPETAPARPRRLLAVALFVSVALNLLVVGVIAGAFWARGDGPGFRPVLIDIGLGPYTRALSEADRATLRDAWQRRGPDLQTLRGARGADRAALLEALRAQPFDPAAVEAAFARQLSRQAGQQQLARTLLTERISAMSPAERAAYADRLEALPQRGDRRPARDDPDSAD